MDADESLFRTLERGLSGWMAPEVRVEGLRGAGGARWRRASLLADYFSAGVVFHPGLGPGPVRFLRRYLAYSPSTMRRLLAMASATWRTSPAGGLRSLSSPLMAVEPDLPDWRQILVLPQAQKVRVLDFGRGVSRVLLREGAPAEALMLDVVSAVQQGGAPFPGVRAVAADGSWYEEDLIDGVPLPLAMLKEEVKEGLVSECLRVLERWQESSERRVAVDAYVTEVMGRIGSLLGHVEPSGRGEAKLTSLLDAIAAKVVPGPSLDTVGLVLSHGEVARRNVIVRGGSMDPVLVGRGDAGERSRRFDRMFYRLDAGTVDSLGLRASGVRPAEFAALFFLEAVEWHLGRFWKTEGGVEADLVLDLLTEAEAFLEESEVDDDLEPLDDDYDDDHDDAIDDAIDDGGDDRAEHGAGGDGDDDGTGPLE